MSANSIADVMHEEMCPDSFMHAPMTPSAFRWNVYDEKGLLENIIHTDDKFNKVKCKLIWPTL